MGQEVFYCSVCRKQIRSSEFEKKTAFRVGTQVACSACAPELLKSLPPDQIQSLLGQLGTPKPPASDAETRPASTRRMSAGPTSSTQRRLAGMTPISRWAIAGFLAAAALVLAILVFTGRSDRSDSATPTSIDARESKASPLSSDRRTGASATAAKGAEADLLREAREFARGNPGDLRGQWSRYEKARRAAEGLPVQDLVRREVDAYLATLRSAIQETLRGLEEPLRAATGEEKFADALELLTKAGARYPEEEWRTASSDKAKLVRESAAGRYAILKEQALDARRRGAESDVKAIRDRLAAWGLADLAGDLDSALARAPIKDPPAADSAGAAKKEEPTAADQKEKPAQPPAPGAGASPAPATPPPTPAAKTSSSRVDEAIRKGIAYLKGAGSPTWEGWNGSKNSHELLLLTFIHSGVVPESDPKFQEYFKEMMVAPPQRTYSAALQAMVLEELDRVRYQGRIAQCAQYLVDNQCQDGQWGYGKTIDLPEFRISYDPKKEAAPKVDASGRRIKPKVLKKFTVQRRMDGLPGGDNSNAQYAALGFRACHDSGILVPRETLERASGWWRVSQQAEEKGKGVATGPGEGRGWSYDPRSPQNGVPPSTKSYGAMTAGATGSLIIYDFLLGKDWKNDPAVKAGMRWMTSHFAVEEHPGIRGVYKDYDLKHWLYYYLYATERLGVLADTASFGPHEWYPKGAEVILGSQRADGSWLSENDPNVSAVWDTCLSILFLKRATQPLVASEDRAIRAEQK